MTPGKINASESASTMVIPIAEQSDKDDPPPPPPPHIDVAEMKKTAIAIPVCNDKDDSLNVIDRIDFRPKQSDKVSMRIRINIEFGTETPCRPPQILKWPTNLITIISTQMPKRWKRSYSAH